MLRPDPGAWRKSSFSASQNCIELAHAGAVRDSKNPDGPVLSVPLHDFLAAVRLPRFAR